MRNIYIYLFIASAQLFAQSTHLFSGETEWIVFNNAIIRKNLMSFELLKAEELPLIPLYEIHKNSIKSYDSNYLYNFELLSDKMTKMNFAQPVTSNRKMSWFWSEPLTMKGNLKFLSASQLQMLVYEKDGADEAGSKVLNIIKIDFCNQSHKIMATLKDTDQNLEAVATVKDGDFYIFINNGTVYKLEKDSSSFIELESNFFTKISEKFIDSIQLAEIGSKKAQLPFFIASPFFSKNKNILIPLKLRERNKWNSQSIRKHFNSISIKEQNKLINSGVWPIKDDYHYEGSAYVFALVEYDLESKKVVSLSPERLLGIVEKNEFVDQYQLVNSEWNPMVELPDGRLIKIESEIKASNLFKK